MSCSDPGNMAKRKRADADTAPMKSATGSTSGNIKKTKNGAAAAPTVPVASNIQIITGSYERILHGVTATIPPNPHPVTDGQNNVDFADTFLFRAHTSAVKCLAVSPPSEAGRKHHPQKVMLASGGSDEKINLYQLSASRPSSKLQALPSLAGHKITENPQNRELGSLLHHSSSVTALYFPSRAKLLSSAEDNTIAVTRARDWTVLSTIKAPLPKIHGRPSGDTAPHDGTPAGVNDFAVHPSMKLMLSVGRGEKCMRLWNLMTGKKAGVLDFSKDILRGVGEGKWTGGEGKKVEWNEEGTKFVAGFERGAVVFGMVLFHTHAWHTSMLTGGIRTA